MRQPLVITDLDIQNMRENTDRNNALKQIENDIVKWGSDSTKN